MVSTDKRVTIRVDEVLYDWLNNEAARLNKSISDVIRDDVLDRALIYCKSTHGNCATNISNLANMLMLHDMRHVFNSGNDRITVRLNTRHIDFVRYLSSALKLKESETIRLLMVLDKKHML